MRSDDRSIPYLLKLLDDESPSVRLAAIRRLEELGPALEDAVNPLGIALNEQQQAVLDPLLHSARRVRLLASWASVCECEEEFLRLEQGLIHLACLQEGKGALDEIPRSLDRLALEASRFAAEMDVRTLAIFLFGQEGFTGAREDYYEPRNSSLLSLLHTRHGLPITLVSLYMLVGHRLGLSIRGCNFPGHFLALAYKEHQPLLVDCFNGGLVLDEAAIRNLPAPSPMRFVDFLRLDCGADVILARVLRNLQNAYRLHPRPSPYGTAPEKPSENPDIILLAQLLDQTRGPLPSRQ